MPDTVAVIDVGSNSIKLLVARAELSQTVSKRLQRNHRDANQRWDQR